MGNMPKNRSLIPFIEPGRFRYLIGGLMSPPYDGLCDKQQFFELPDEMSLPPLSSQLRQGDEEHHS